MKTNHVILGLWPIAGITTVDTNPEQSRQTIEAALASGVTTYDTAFSYGYDGESDRLLGEVLAGQREQFRIISKVGQRWNSLRQRVVDASRETMLQDCETSLRRLNTDYIDLMMLHSVDPQIDVRVSAETLLEMQRRGYVREVGMCISPIGETEQIAELELFSQVAVPTAIQGPLNMLQRGLLNRVVPWCRERSIDVHVYWVLMKGILAGAIGPDHQFAAGDSRPKYEIYQGEYRRKTHGLLSRLSEISTVTGLSVSQLSVGWAISQSGISAALLGAKKPQQILETAASLPLAAEIISEIDEEIAKLD